MMSKTTSSTFLIVQLVIILLDSFVYVISDSAPTEPQHSVLVNTPVRRNQGSSSLWISTPNAKTAKGHTRCFCNLPSCITTGYMCKSPSGGCFSDVQHRMSIPTAYKGRHGCLELLSDNEQREWCQANPKMHVHKKKTHPRSLLYCCYSDLCNHVDNPETTNLIDESEYLFNDSARSARKPQNSHIAGQQRYSETEVWFKAATIAVPICGTVIVLVLILLAVHLLKSESSANSRLKFGEKYVPTQHKNNGDKYRIQRELMPIQRNPVYTNGGLEELQQIRAPLLVQNHLDIHNHTKNTNTGRFTSMNAYDSSLSEIDGYCCTHQKKIGNCEYAHSYPEVHRKNLFRDSIVVNSSLMKAKTYDKMNLQQEQ